MMTKESLAALLNGRTRRGEINDSEALEAKAKNLVVVFGYSDDNLEFAGAINDELGAWDGCTAHIFKGANGRWVAMTEESVKEITDEIKDKNIPFALQSYVVTAEWEPEDEQSTWLVTTDMPHATFNVMSDDDENEVFCRAVVIDLTEL